MPLSRCSLGSIIHVLRPMHQPRSLLLGSFGNQYDIGRDHLVSASPRGLGARASDAAKVYPFWDLLDGWLVSLNL